MLEKDLDEEEEEINTSSNINNIINEKKLIKILMYHPII